MGSWNLGKIVNKKTPEGHGPDPGESFIFHCLKQFPAAPRDLKGPSEEYSAVMQYPETLSVVQIGISRDEPLFCPGSPGDLLM